MVVQTGERTAEPCVDCSRLGGLEWGQRTLQREKRTFGLVTSGPSKCHS